MKQARFHRFGTLVAVVAMATASFGLTQEPQMSAVGLDDSTFISVDALAEHFRGTPKGALSQEEREALIYMREEEKLAFDVYGALGKRWGLRIFDNIGQAEQTHMNSVKVLLDRYGIADPAEGKAPGEFRDPALQRLYNDLLTTGSASRIGALKVGAEVDDVDIFDLARWLKTTRNPDVQMVFGNLERGSRNHLRAFTRNLRASGADYKPKYIDQATFDQIVAGTTQQGGGAGPKRGRRGGGGF